MCTKLPATFGLFPVLSSVRPRTIKSSLPLALFTWQKIPGSPRLHNFNVHVPERNEASLRACHVSSHPVLVIRVRIFRNNLGNARVCPGLQAPMVLMTKLKVSPKKLKLVQARYHLGSRSNTYGEVSLCRFNCWVSIKIKLASTEMKHGCGVIHISSYYSRKSLLGPEGVQITKTFR